jgi:ATP-binding cassette, subfamily B, multidrug efflux pump
LIWPAQNQIQPEWPGVPEMRGQSYSSPEESLGKVVDTRIIRRLFKYAKPYTRFLLLAMLLAALLSATDIVLPYLTKVGIDSYIVSRGKRIDLTALETTHREEVNHRYEDKTIHIDDHHIFIKEGIIDPADRKRFTNRNALDPLNYYTLDVQRYKPEKQSEIKAIIRSHTEDFLPTADPDIHLIDTEKLAQYPAAERGLIRHPDWIGIATISLIYLGILFVGLLLMFGQVYLMAWVGQYIMYDIRLGLFEHIERQPIQFFNKQPTGRLVTRVTNDVNVLNEMFTSILVELFKNILKLVGIVFAMLWLAPRLALATFALLPVIILVTWIFKVKMRDAYRVVRMKIAMINAMLSEHISGIKIIQMFAKEKIHFNKFKDLNHECYQANMRQLIVHSMFSPFIVFLENLGIALILYYGGGQVIRDAVSLGTLVAFLGYLSMFFGPVRDIAEKFNIMQSAMASSERIFQILDKPKEDENDRDLPIPDQSLRGEIEFDRVWFSYEPDDWVLRDVSFKVNPGETVALVGATGSGKTTIINLLSKFFSIQKGSIRIDGMSADKYSRYYLRKQMAVVLQDVFLFAGDIRKNIRLNNSEITDDQIEEAARIAHADKFISKLPDGYDHKVEEGGTTLSQGQRQLLAFSRALAFNPSILVLDEATANIDSETEKWIQKALEQLLSSRTAVVVAHRLSTIKRADKILVMHRGKIREMGDHQSLLEKKGIYYRLYQLQYKHQDT